MYMKCIVIVVGGDVYYVLTSFLFTSVLVCHLSSSFFPCPQILLRRCTCQPPPSLPDYRAARDATALTMDVGFISTHFPHVLLATTSSSLFAASSSSSPSSSSSSSLSPADTLLLQVEIHYEHSEITQIFRAYSQLEIQGGLYWNYKCWEQWCKDVKICSRNLKQTQVDAIYKDIISKNTGSILTSSLMSLHQFLHALLLIGHAKYHAPSIGLVECLSMVFRNDLKKSRKVQPDLLKGKLRTTEALEVSATAREDEEGSDGNTKDIHCAG